MVAPPQQQLPSLQEKQVKSGAGWFHWIAGLTLLNIVVALSGSGLGFGLSLMLPVGIAEWAHDHHLGLIVGIINVVLCSFILGFFILVAQFALKGARWAFIVGVVCYGIDAILWIASGVKFAFFIHLYAIWNIGIGLSAANKLHKLRREAPMPLPSAPNFAPGMVTSASTNPGVWPPPPAAEASLHYANPEHYANLEAASNRSVVPQASVEQETDSK